MGKTLETKKRIMGLLRKRNMTISELSRELDLSTATISQHMEELQRMGAIEKIDNEHFKKLKYYRANEGMNMNIVKYVIGAFVVIIAVAALFLYTGRASQLSYPTSPPTNLTNSTGTSPIGGLGAFACPMMTYQLNGSIYNYTGASLYYLNSSNGQVADYVMHNNSMATLSVVESVRGVLSEPNQNFSTNRMHYAYVTPIVSTGNVFRTEIPGINITFSPSTYNAVNNTTLYFTAAIRTNSTVSGTYWLRLDGPCGGGVQEVLLTIGNGPYRGNVTQTAVPYA